MSLIKELVEQDFGIEGRGKWYHSSDHDSLVVNDDENYFFWNSRGLKGGPVEYLVQVRGMDKASARNFLNNFFGAFKENSEISENGQPYEKLVDVLWNNGIDNREYWYSRCLTDETIDRRRLGYYNGWYTIPIYRDGEFVNFQKRRDEPKKSMHYWYKTGEVYLFNEGILPYIRDRVYITEGLVDAILLNQEGIPAISATGVNTWRQDWFSKFSRIKEMIYLADNDAAGYLGAKSVAQSLGMYRVKIVTFDGKHEKYDTGDFFKEYKSKDVLMEWIDTHSHYLFELEVVYGKTKDIGRYRKEFSWAR